VVCFVLYTPVAYFQKRPRISLNFPLDLYNRLLRNKSSRFLEMAISANKRITSCLLDLN
jgi:hypothetical protein